MYRRQPAKCGRDLLGVRWPPQMLLSASMLRACCAPVPLRSGGDGRAAGVSERFSDVVVSRLELEVDHALEACGELRKQTKAVFVPKTTFDPNV